MNRLLGCRILGRRRARSEQLLGPVDYQRRVCLHVDDGVHLSEYGSREVAIAVLKFLGKTR